MSTLLSVAAHPDDASIFWGGTLARLVDEGWSVTSLVVDDGRGSPHSFEMDAETLMATRHDELRWESLRLGVAMRHLQLPGVKTPENRAKCHEHLLAALHELRPVRVITHSLNDSHATHRMVSKLALRAIAAAHAGDGAFDLPEFWQADGWEPVHYPNLRVDVSRYMNTKMAAIAQNRSQTFDTPYMAGAWGLCLYRAGMAASHEVTDPGMAFAEAFRTTPKEELVALAAANDPEA